MREVRVKLQIPARVVADELYVDESTVFRLENGMVKRVPSYYIEEYEKFLKKCLADTSYVSRIRCHRVWCIYARSHPESICSADEINHFRQMRKELRLTQTEVGKIIGTGHSAVSARETGKTKLLKSEYAALKAYYEKERLNKQ